VADLEKLMLVKGCGPIMVRLSWHDAGVFNGADGCPNAAMRLAGGGEHAFGANAGLPQVAIPLLQAISDKYVPRLISHADLWALAANVAIKVMGGPDIVTHFGRVDAQSPSDGATSAAGRLPDGDKDAQHLRDIFRPKGFTDKDIVALSGAHTVGACHADRSGFEGPWTADKLKFDNTYFQDLLNKTWSMETVKSGNKQYRSGKEMMLTTAGIPALRPGLSRVLWGGSGMGEAAGARMWSATRVEIQFHSTATKLYAPGHSSESFGSAVFGLRILHVVFLQVEVADMWAKYSLKAVLRTVLAPHVQSAERGVKLLCDLRAWFKAGSRAEPLPAPQEAPFSKTQIMGNTACCQSEANDGVADAHVDAKPILESALPAAPFISGGDSEQERIYQVTLSKSPGQKLGLDVDYMAERKILPIMHVTGGIAEEWNKKYPDRKLSSGDSILEVNGISGDVVEMLERCKADDTLKMKLCRCLTYDHLVEDLEKLIRRKDCGPIMVRLSWHDAGIYNGADGCPNAAMRLPGGGEHALAANAGLPQVAIPLLEPIAAKYVPRMISHADLWALAANVAIKVMGGPELTTRFGRLDAERVGDGASSATGRLPDGDKDARHLRDIFYPKGFDDKAIVALSGAHTVGSCHLDRSGFDGAWTADKLKFDNSYFKDLMHRSWSSETTSKGNPQFRCAESKTMMLTTDMALVNDPDFKRYVIQFADDQKSWFSEFDKGKEQGYKKIAMQHGTSPLRAGWERRPLYPCATLRRFEYERYLSTFTFFALGSVGAALHMFRARTSVPAVQPVHSTLRRTAILNIAGLAAGPILPASALVGSTLSPEIEEKVKLDGGGIADFTKTPDGLRILDLASGKGDECCAQDDIVVVDWSLRRSNGYFVDASFGFDPGRGIDEKFGVGSPELRFSPIGDKDRRTP
ncbi:APX3, partial [Symbiodinium microadriaticum]